MILEWGEHADEVVSEHDSELESYSVSDRSDCSLSVTATKLDCDLGRTRELLDRLLLFAL